MQFWWQFCIFLAIIEINQSYHLTHLLQSLCFGVSEPIWCVHFLAIKKIAWLQKCFRFFFFWSQRDCKKTHIFWHFLIYTIDCFHMFLNTVTLHISLDWYGNIFFMHSEFGVEQNSTHQNSWSWHIVICMYFDDIF